MNGTDERADSTDANESRSMVKRRSADGASPPVHRGKRQRYISIACNECKRRKIKCNGETPCQRSGNLQLGCVYAPNCCSNGFKDSDEFRQMSTHIQSLQDQVNDLYANINALRSVTGGDATHAFHHAQSMGPLDPQMAYMGQPSPPEEMPFKGPTAAAFNFDLANNSLKAMGITDNNESSYDSVEVPKRMSSRSASQTNGMMPRRDPLWELSRPECMRLCRLYEEEVQLLYPMLDMEFYLKRADSLMKMMETMARNGTLKQEKDREALHDDDSLIIRMVIATTLTMEGSGESDLGLRMFEYLRETVGNRMWHPAGVKGLQLLVEMSLYHFHTGAEASAYRIIGIAARICFEMGLHRFDNLRRKLKNKDELNGTIRLFWIIYVLDRRWSFGTGMPFAIQDSDIDPHLPKPTGSTYLSLMVDYCRVAATVWKTVGTFDISDNDVKKEHINFLDFQIQEWLNSFPESFRFQPSDNAPNNRTLTRSQRRVRLLLYLRANQMRILIYRPLLHSATSILSNREYAQVVVDVAKDTIRVLSELNQTSDIYRVQQICFNHFLVSALAVLYLAVSHTPVEFSRHVRDEFYMALDLIREFSTRSYISRRLWRTIKGLKKVGPKLGLADNNPEHPQRSTNTTTVMMNNSGSHGGVLSQVDDFSMFAHMGQGKPETSNSSSSGMSPIDANQMSFELTNLFEAAGNGMSDMMNGWKGETEMPSFPLAPTPESMKSFYGGEDEFARLMRDCF